MNLEPSSRRNADRNAPGFTLFEVVATTSIFLLVMATTAVLLRYSVRNFANITSRSNAQGQLLAIKAALGPDLQRAHFSGIDHREVTVQAQLRNSSATVSSRRDVLSIVSLADWVVSQGGGGPQLSYGYGGIPNWDSYVVYAAGRTSESTTTLTRYVLHNHSLASQAISLGSLTGIDQFDGTGTVPHADALKRRTTLAESVAHFETDLDEQRQMVKVVVRVLEDTGELTAAGEESGRMFTAVFSIRPYNTIPKL